MGDLPAGIEHGPCTVRLVFELDYRLVGRGWSETGIRDAHGHATVTASYLSDALLGLIEAVTAITEGAATARCSFEEEPGEYRWIFDRQADAVDLRILSFDDMCGEPDGAGALLFRTTQPVLRIARAVLSATQRLLDETGEDGYSIEWVRHPLPTDAMARLRNAIKSPPGPPGSCLPTRT